MIYLKITDELVGISSLSHQEEVSANEATVPSSVPAAPVDLFAWFESPGEVVNNIDVGDPFTPNLELQPVPVQLRTCSQASMWTQVRCRIHMQQQKVQTWEGKMATTSFLVSLSAMGS